MVDSLEDLMGRGWRRGTSRCSPQWLGRAETLLFPAALGQVEIRGPVEVLTGYLPDL